GANRVLLTIEICSVICDEALSRGVSMIVSYNTPIFSGFKSLNLAMPLPLLRCVVAGISVYSPHSPLDGVSSRINDGLAQ
ncbi:hypothetical protein B0H11DRAFT_1663842, partial [Mycena galericulata]